MGCSNCFNGCTDIVSDQCVKYTGVDVPVLGILKGDSLSYVEQALIEFLTSTIDGTGIKPDIDPAIICTLVNGYLPTCGDITIIDLINALIQSACDLQDQVTAVQSDIAVLNGDYTISCLTGVTAASDTHVIVQAIITKLCSLDTDLTVFALDVSTNYVQLADLNALIAAYLTSISFGTLISNRMVPYSVVPYFGPLTNFDITGAGTGDWIDIYLCNGENGTPDMRGRVPVGTVSAMGGGVALDVEVDPMVSAFNYDYALLDTEGVNYLTLGISQMPSHTHTASSVVTDSGHFHYEFNDDISLLSFVSATNYPAQKKEWTTGNAYNYQMSGTDTVPTSGKSSTKVTGITVATTNASTGSSNAHANTQPVIAFHYITYIP